MSLIDSAPAFPVYRAGRHPQLSFRGLLKVHSRYGPPVCSPPTAHFCPQSLSREVSLTYCLGSYRDEPTISRAELSSAGILHPRGAPLCCGFKLSAKSVESSRAGESHPHPLTEPDVNLSAHPAPIVQPKNKQSASVQTTMVDVF
jgi:hypothetical protein